MVSKWNESSDADLRHFYNLYCKSNDDIHIQWISDIVNEMCFRGMEWTK